MDSVFDGEKLTVFALIKKEAALANPLSVEVELLNTATKERATFSSSEVTRSEETAPFVYQLAARSMIERAARTGSEESKEVTEISLKYQVLAKTTAFFGKIKNKSKSGSEMEKIEIPVLNQRENSIRKKNQFVQQHTLGMMMNSSARGRGARMKCAAVPRSMMNNRKKSKKMSKMDFSMPKSSRRDVHREKCKPASGLMMKEQECEEDEDEDTVLDDISIASSISTLEAPAEFDQLLAAQDFSGFFTKVDFMVKSLDVTAL